MKSHFNPIQGEIIWEGRILSDEAMIEQSLGRKRQIVNLRTCLKAMIRGRLPINMWVHGPAGSGKTTIARWAVDTFCSHHASRIGLYINCWQHRTLHGVVQAVVQQLQILGAEAHDTDFKLDRIRQAVHQKSVILILDEFDRLLPTQREEIIYGLLTLPQTGLICVAHDTRTLALMDARVRSRLGPFLVEFPAYSTRQIRLILADRAQRALAPESWTPSTIQRIAAAVNGDCRIALHILRQAAAQAEERGLDKLASRSVDQIINSWENVRHQVRLVHLSEHERIIQELVQQQGPVGTIKLMETYVNYCHESDIQPLARRTFAKYLNRLAGAGMVKVADQPAGPGGRIVQAA